MQELFDAGAIRAAEAVRHSAANIITHAVGADVLELDKVTDRLCAGDRFLLCSDGLFKALPERDLAEMIAAGHDDTAGRLLAAALARHADDNVAVITVEVLRDGSEV